MRQRLKEVKVEEGTKEVLANMNLAKNFYKSTKASVIGSSDVQIMVLHLPC